MLSPHYPSDGYLGLLDLPLSPPSKASSCLLFRLSRPPASPVVFSSHHHLSHISFPTTLVLTDIISCSSLKSAAFKSDMSSSSSVHAILARRIGLPQAHRTQDESQLAPVTKTETSQPQQSVDSESQLAQSASSPAGSLFDGSDEDTDDVPKLALDDVSDTVPSKLKVSRCVRFTRSANFIDSPPKRSFPPRRHSHLLSISHFTILPLLKSNLSFHMIFPNQIPF